MEKTRILVAAETFDVGQQYAWLAEEEGDGAVVTFTGKVRRDDQREPVSALTLEHYPGMTEKTLTEIVAQARQRWDIRRVAVIHRIGRMTAGEAIVFVGVSGGHRADAFAAAQFIMDFLKTRAPFWKRETRPEGERWVAAKAGDQQAMQRWLNDYASVSKD